MSDVIVFVVVVGVLTAAGIAGGFAFGRRFFAWDDARARAAAAAETDAAAAAASQTDAVAAAGTDAGSAEPEPAPSDTLASDEHGGIDG